MNFLKPNSLHSSNMELVERVLKYLHERRERNVAGKINCIPSPFPGFREAFVGIEKKTYYIVTANQKCAKTQFTSFMFLYHPLLYAYKHPDQLRVKFFVAPLEESKEQAVERFIRYILYNCSGQKIRISPKELSSTIEGEPLPQEILDLLDQEPYKGILEFFQDRVTFIDEKNPTGIYKQLVKYALEHGTREQEEITIKNEFGVEEKVKRTIQYIPQDPEEYVILMIDHAGLLGQESGLSLRETIKKMSNYCMELRDTYSMCPVMIQQQSVENQTIEAFKLVHIRPTVAGLADCKDTRYDATVMMGLSNPYAMEQKTFIGYDISKLGDNQRFFEIMLDRWGMTNAVEALYFDGAVSYFAEMPAPNDTAALEKVYAWIKGLRKPREKTHSFLIFSKIRQKLTGKNQ